MASNAQKSWSRPEDMINVLIGAYLFITPWLYVGTDDTAASWNAWIVGAVIVLLSLGALASGKMEAPEYLDAVVGIWAIISPWVLGFTDITGMAISFWAGGAVVLLLALGAQQRLHRAGGGGKLSPS